MIHPSGASTKYQPKWLERADGGARQLADKMRKQVADLAEMTLQESDRDDTTKEAVARGDYDSRGNYRPWHPDEERED